VRATRTDVGHDCQHGCTYFTRRDSAAFVLHTATTK
jgi:hypothetical protein